MTASGASAPRRRPASRRGPEFGQNRRGSYCLYGLNVVYLLGDRRPQVESIAQGLLRFSSEASQEVPISDSSSSASRPIG